MPTHRTTPEQRAKRQLAALRATTQRTLKALAKHPDDHRSAAILDWHEHQVDKISRPKQKHQPVPPPAEFCWTCEKWHPKPRPEEYHLPDGLQWPFAVAVTAVFLLLAVFVEWWAFVVFPVAWLVSFSFVWSFIIPAALLMVVIVFLLATGM
jgi:hypothetical protein